MMINELRLQNQKSKQFSVTVFSFTI